MPFDDMATDHNSGALDFGAGVCDYELCELSYDEGLGLRLIRP